MIETKAGVSRYDGKKLTNVPKTRDLPPEVKRRPAAFVGSFQFQPLLRGTFAEFHLDKRTVPPKTRSDGSGRVSAVQCDMDECRTNIQWPHSQQQETRGVNAFPPAARPSQLERWFVVLAPALFLGIHENMVVYGLPRYARCRFLLHSVVCASLPGGTVKPATSSAEKHRATLPPGTVVPKPKRNQPLSPKNTRPPQETHEI